MRGGIPGRFFMVGLAALITGPAGCAFAKSRGLKDIESVPPSCRDSTYGAGDWVRRIQVGGRERSYIVHVPPGYVPGRAMPAVLFFHGGGGTATRARNFQGWDDLANRRGFITVYPDGTGKFGRMLHTWNAGSCCGWAMDHRIDDVGFVRAMLDDLGRLFCIDARRVYASGFSNGALMCYRLGCELSDRIAAIGPVSGTLGVDACRLSRPVSVIHFHGTKDTYEPYIGGEGRAFPGSRRKHTYRSVSDTVTTWKRLIGAPPRPTSTSTRGAATCDVYGGGPGGSEVVLWTLKGGGHTWPGGGRMPGQWTLGQINKDVSATELIWDFFERHPMR